MEIFTNYSNLILIIGALTVLTNIITQVIKPFTQIKLPSEFLATIVSEVLTILSYFAYSSYKGLPVYWYTVVAAVIVGFLVSYAAQFGFDKLKDALKSIKGKEE